MLTARQAARFLPPDHRAWSLSSPPWWAAQETLDARLRRQGLVLALTHR